MRINAGRRSQRRVATRSLTSTLWPALGRNSPVSWIFAVLVVSLLMALATPVTAQIDTQAGTEDFAVANCAVIGTPLHDRGFNRTPMSVHYCKGTARLTYSFT